MQVSGSAAGHVPTVCFPPGLQVPPALPVCGLGCEMAAGNTFGPRW